MKKRILSAVLACAATMTFATAAFAEEAVTTAADNAPEIGGAVMAGFKVDTNGIGGTALNDLLLVTEDGTRYKWSDVQMAMFQGDGDFNLCFAADASKAGTDLVIVGETEIPAEYAEEVDFEFDVDDAQASEVESGEGTALNYVNSGIVGKEFDLFDTTKPDGGELTIAAVEGEVNIVATITFKAGAVGTPAATDNNTVADDNSVADDTAATTTTNPGTGIALAVAPAALAVAFVSVAAVVSKKKK